MTVPLAGWRGGTGSYSASPGSVSVSADQTVLPTVIDRISNLPNRFGLRDKYRYFACLLRARFEEHRNEKDMMKATQLLREAEEEFWHSQHPQPYIFPDSPGGTSYERYECYKVSQDYSGHCF